MTASVFSAVRYDLAVEQGSTFNIVFEWREDDGSSPPTGALIDLTGYSAHLQIRAKQGGALLANLTIGSGLSLSDGVVTVRIGADVTSTIYSGAVYDLELHSLTDATEVVRLAYGAVRISPQVTSP